MKSIMSMTVDTTWGNAATLVVESELDNGHQLSMAEIARLQVFTLSMMHAEVRRENERVLNITQNEERRHSQETLVGEMERTQRGE